LSKVVPLIMFGMGLIGAGAFWSVFNGVRYYFNPFEIEDSYFLLMELGWNAMPVIVILGGIMCLIAAAFSAARYRRVEE